MTSAQEPGKGSGPPAEAAPAEGGKAERIVVRDNRKLKAGGKGSAARTAAPAADPPPATPVDAPAQPADAEPPAAGGLGAELNALRSELDERTRDLQRVSAEYANYRKRVERDRTMAAEEATAGVFRALLPVFDDLDRAREHGELSEGVAAVVDHLVAAAGKFGLTPFGEQGEPFDPTRHEAVAHLTSPEVSEPSCVDVFRRGYLLGERLLRPAMVAVADPEPEPAPEAEPAREAESPPEAEPAPEAEQAREREAAAGSGGGEPAGAAPEDDPAPGAG